MEDPPFPKTRDVLINQLNFKIKYLQPRGLTEKILATLTNDKSNQELLDLLMNDSLLEERVEKIILLLDQDKREVLGSKLFQSVSCIEQELSAQVTGMLLELPVTVINGLLNNSKDLEKAVTKAKREFLFYLKNGTGVMKTDENNQNFSFHHSNNESSSDSKRKLLLSKDDVGEILYEKLLQTYPHDAPKLTGMLLQMNLEDLVGLLSNDQLLNEKVNVALSVLKRAQ